MNLLDADLLSQVPGFPIAIAGNNQDAVHSMARLQMADEPQAVPARRIVKTERRRVLVVEKYHALETRFQRGKRNVAARNTGP